MTGWWFGTFFYFHFIYGIILISHTKYRLLLIFANGLCGGVTQHDSREFSVFLGGLSQDEACEAGPRSNQAEFSESN